MQDDPPYGADNVFHVPTGHLGEEGQGEDALVEGLGAGRGGRLLALSYHVCNRNSNFFEATPCNLNIDFNIMVVGCAGNSTGGMPLRKHRLKGRAMVQASLEDQVRKWKRIAMTEEVVEYILSLNTKVAIKVVRSISLLDDLGTQLSDDYLHFIGNIRGVRLWELRTKFHNFHERILFVNKNGRFYLLLSGFTKTTDKVPPQEIERAIRILREYEG